MADGVQFDLLASGQPVQTGWVAPSDGLLVRDLNADGMINNGTELFGNATVLADGSTASDGYQALAELDSNHDGVISNADAVYSQLGVWVDANSDGISEAGEVQSLTALGITEIAVTAQVTDTQDHGNTIGLTSSYQTADGVSHLAGDVWFAAQDAASYLAASELQTATLAVLPTVQVSALTTAQLQALSTDGLEALASQSVAAMGDAQALAMLNPPSLRSPSAFSVQEPDGCDPPAEQTAQDLAVALEAGLAKRASELAHAISSFDAANGLRSVAVPSLNMPVDAYGATLRSASLAIGHLVDQMRNFESHTPATLVTGMGTAAPTALVSMQVAPFANLDPLKQTVLNDFGNLSGMDLKR